MRILDRYVLKPIIETFLGCLFIFISLYIISDTISRLDEILKNHIAITFLCKYYLSSLPKIFTETSPIAILLATIYNLGKLNCSNELTAMRSSGLSLWQITSPVMITGLILSVLVFVVNEKFIPQAQAEADKMKAQIENSENKTSKEKVIANLAFYGLRNRLFFVNSFDLNNSMMEGISILGHDSNQNLTYKIFAKKGLYKDNHWIFYEFTRYNFDSYGQIKGDVIYNPEQIMDITETPHDLMLQRKRPEFMNIAQLEDYIWRLKKSGAKGALRNLLVELYQRYSTSFTSLVLILIGIPFSFASHKRANLFSSFGICIAISFLYYIVTAISLNLGKSGIIFPFLSAWLAPISFSMAAFNQISKSS